MMTLARLRTSASESCFRRAICRGVKEGKPPALTARVAFVLPNEAKYDILFSNETKKGITEVGLW
jgi:hypothetical protein